MSDQKEFEKVKPLLNVREEPVGTIYTPPDGEPIDREGIYLPDDPSTMTDRLVNTERRFILPMAQVVGRVFHVPPLNDDIWRSLPQDMRASNLYVIVSRSDIRQTESNVITWPAIRVVVKEYEVVQIHVVRDFAEDTCDIFEMFLWRNIKDGYDHVKDPQGRPIGPQALMTVLSRYAQVEGILPRSLIPFIGH